MEENIENSGLRTRKELSKDEFEESYVESCNEIQTEPNKFFLDLIDGWYRETGKILLDYDLSGSQIPLFNKRITNSDVSCILTTMLSKQLPVNSIKLAWNILDDGSVPIFEEFLKKNGSLRFLDVTSNSFTPEGVARLCESLMANFFLESLVLDENDVGEVGGLRIGVLLQQNISIRHVSLKSTNLTVRSVLSILDSIKSHGSLMIFSMSHISGKYFDLPDLDAFYYRLQNCLYLNSNLKRLYLPYCKLRDEGLEYLVRGLSLNKHNSVEVLDVKGNGICVDGAKTLVKYLSKSRYCRIKVLDLSFNRIQTIGCEFFTAAFKNGETKLEELNLSSNSIEDIGLFQFAETLSASLSALKLKKLFILENNKFEQRSKKAFFELYEKKKDVLELDMKPYCVMNNENFETYHLAREKVSDDFFGDIDYQKAIDEYKEEISEIIEKERKKN